MSSWSIKGNDDDDDDDAPNTTGCNNDNNDNDKRLGLTAKADQPDHKKSSTLKIKIDNEAVQK